MYVRVCRVVIYLFFKVLNSIKSKKFTSKKFRGGEIDDERIICKDIIVERTKNISKRQFSIVEFSFFFCCLYLDTGFLLIIWKENILFGKL